MNEVPAQESNPHLDTLKAVVMVPVYNDWEAVTLLLNNIDSAVDDFGIDRISVLLVDDASSHSRPEPFLPVPLKKITSIEILRLNRNLGHQRAIAVGLVHLFQHDNSDITIIMDGDGEDNPADIAKLLQAAIDSNLKKIVFAERTIRSEGVLFYIFYQLYRFLNWILTGCKIRFGNFSAVPRYSLKSLVTVSELWNHYAASVIASKIPFILVPTTRKKRYSGQSKMSFIGLVTHGLSSIAVHREVVCTRILMSITAGGFFTLCILVGSLFCERPGHLGVMIYLLGIGVVTSMLVQMLSIVLSLVFIVLGNRDIMTFLPVRDCAYFIDKVDSVLLNNK